MGLMPTVGCECLVCGCYAAPRNDFCSECQRKLDNWDAAVFLLEECAAWLEHAEMSEAEREFAEKIKRFLDEA